MNELANVLISSFPVIPPLAASKGVAYYGAIFVTKYYSMKGLKIAHVLINYFYGMDRNPF